jgi:hypothetical protein
MRKDTTLGVRISWDLKDVIDEKAQEAGLTITELLTEALELRCDMPKDFWDYLVEAGKMLKLTPARIMIHIVLKNMAFIKAWQEVFGNYPPSTNIEFRYDEKGFVSGDALFNQLYEEFKTHLEEAQSKMEAIGTTRPMLDVAEIEAMLQGIKPTKQWKENPP